MSMECPVACTLLWFLVHEECKSHREEATEADCVKKGERGMKALQCGEGVACETAWCDFCVFMSRIEVLMDHGSTAYRCKQRPVVMINENRYNH